MSSVYGVIQKVKATSSKNEKIAILTENKDNKVLARALQLMYDETCFYLRQVPKPTINSSAQHFDLGTAIEAIAELLPNRTLTGDAARNWVAMVLADLSPEDQHVISCILKKDADAGFSEKTVNKVWKNSIKETPYRRCTRELSTIKFPAIAQTKADGSFVNIILRNHTVSILSRTGKHIDCLGVVEDRFEKFNDHNLVMHGEILVVDENGNILSRKEGNGIINKAIKGTISEAEASRIVFKLWDTIPYDEWVKGSCGLQEQFRLETTKSIINDLNHPTIMLSDTEIVNNLEEANDFYQRQLQKGEEGAILKNLNGLWKTTSSGSKDAVKMKAEEDCDLLCYDFIPHSKQPELIGSLRCKSADGKILVDVGAGLTAADRARDPEYFIGKVVALLYNQVVEDSKTGQESLYLPRYIEVRADKKVADSRKDIK